MNKIFEEIAAERARQNEKWGEQSLPMTMNDFDIQECRETLEYLRQYNDTNHKKGCANWHDILSEEMLEAFVETDPVKQREEMIQVCAVAVQIVEYLDRQINGGKG